MGNKSSAYGSTFSSQFGTKVYRSKLSVDGSPNSYVEVDVDDPEKASEVLREKQKQKLKKSTPPPRPTQGSRGRSVSVDVRSMRRHSTALHENLVKINFNRQVRDVYSGIDSNHNALGEGSWGKVKLVRRRSDPKRKAAVKILKLSPNMKEGRMKELRSEIELLQRIDHPHIAKLHETYEEADSNLYLVMEYLSGGELFERVISLGHFTESKAADAVKQMVGAIQYLHDKGIVHRDLKLENFMYRAKGSDNLVLIDFGLSTKYSEFDDSDGLGTSRKGRKYLKDMVGSSYYMAPEVMRRRYGLECDMWSIGVIAYMLLSGHPPFAGDTDEEIMKRVRRGKYHFNHSAFRKVSDNAKDFVENLLVYDPKDRMTAKQALSHPWLSEHHRKMMQRRSQRRGSVIEGKVVQNLRNFVNTNKFKKLALQAVAYSTSYEEIANLQQLFEDIDQDQDGYITLEELQNALKDHPGLDQHFVKRVFRAMDIDKTQKVHLNQFIAATMNRSLQLDEKILREAFRKLDISETGEIRAEDLSELLGKQYTQEQVDLMFQEFVGMTKGSINASRTEPSAGPKVEKVTQEQFIKAMRRMKFNQTESLLKAPSKVDGEESETESTLSDKDVPI